jgi:hypothetical protein
VVALRTLLISRKRTVKPKKGRPRLLQFVNGWMVGLVGRGETGREMMQGTEMEGEELKIVRKRIWRERGEERRQARGKGAESLENSEAEREDGREDDEKKEKEEEEIGREAYDSDFEDEIIDHYAALRSTLYIPSMKASPGQTPSLTTGTSARSLSSLIEIEGRPRPDALLRPPASSIYSPNPSSEESTYEPPRRAAAWCTQESAGKQAQQYHNLLPLPEERLPRSRSVREGKRWEGRKNATLQTPPSEQRLPRLKSVRDEERRQTRWSLFCD